MNVAYLVCQLYTNGAEQQPLHLWSLHHREDRKIQASTCVQHCPTAQRLLQLSGVRITGDVKRSDFYSIRNVHRDGKSDSSAEPNLIHTVHIY